jgi:hypothetical protein
LALTEYDFDLEYIKGEENVAADAMSRVDTEDTVTSDDTVIVPDNFEDISRAKDIDNKTLLPNPIIVEQVNKMLVLASRKPTDFDVEIRSVHGGIEGHWGVRATIKRLQEKGIEWKNMSRDVKSFVQSCPICQKLTDMSEAQKNMPHMSFTVSVEEPNQRVAIDTIGPLHEDDRGYKYVLVFIDCMSRFVDLKPTKTVSAPECAEKLLEYFGQNGPPGEILSDRNKEFLNNLVKEFFKIANVKSKLSIPYKLIRMRITPLWKDPSKKCGDI